jgi:AcrR family transcriptional regulator
MPRHPDEERQQLMSETRQRLLDAATREFSQQGFDGARVDRISQAAGFAKGTIYNYFASKRDLMLALIREFAAAHLAFISEAVLATGDAESRIERFFEAGFSFVTEHLARGRVIVQTLYGSDSEFKQLLSEEYRPMFELVARDIIAPGVAQGVFQDLEPSMAAGLVMNIYLAVSRQLEEDGSSLISPQQVADFVLNGLRVRA